PFKIYREVKERRVYRDLTPSSLESRLVFRTGTTGSAVGDTNTVVTVDHLDPANKLLAREKHTFFGDARHSLLEANPLYFYPAWNDGKEFQTEQMDFD